MGDRTWEPPPPEVLERAQREYERVLAREEVNRLLAVPLTEEEREEKRELIRWFRRRYPTPLERSACVRRAWRRWKESSAGR